MKRLIWLVVIGLIFGLGTRDCFSAETVVKVDDYSANITISETNEVDGVRTSISREKRFTLKELEESKSSAEAALKSWQEEKVKAETNIAEQTNRVAMWDRLILEAKNLKIIEKLDVVKKLDVVEVK